MKKYMNLSEYPAGTVIKLDGDKYEKSLQFWEPQDPKLNRVLVRQMDEWQGQLGRIEIVSLPWDISMQLIETILEYKYNIDAYHGMSRFDILAEAIEEVARKEQRRREQIKLLEREDLSFLLGEN